MKVTAKRVKIVIMAFIVCLFAAVGAFCLFISRDASYAETTVVGEDDVFEITDTQFDAEDGFVFSATANFKSGAAAGLVFGASDKTSFVFNTDRASNEVKLMYFDYSSGEKKVYVLKSEPYVGTALMNDGEREYVRSRTSNIDKVFLKVIVKPDTDGIYAEFYADGIRRFAYVNGSEEAVKFDISSLSVVGDGDETVNINYDGGKIGYNCFNANVSFTDEIIDDSDKYYYTEPYRNQYHFSQYAHWNNDPNGMVYYNGYYHLYYQHNPYGNTWDAMHWGHARSRDLVHWEHLPIALVPDYDLPEGENKFLGGMWSGSARVYHKGDSDKIDNEYQWFGDVSNKQDGDELGLIGFYTRDGGGANGYQIVMYSTDGGLSWHKSVNIPNTTSKTLKGSPKTGGSWRDPKVFDISGIDGISDGYRWGMALTDMDENTLFFLKSRNLVEWEHAGCYECFRPECPDVVFLNDGTRDRTVITFTSRYYVVCDLAYNDGNIVMKDSDGKIIQRFVHDDPHFRKMEYGVDSYAAQTFYIDKNSDSKYAGKSVGLNWFSGVPDADVSIDSGILQSARKVWNGGGLTIPVVYGLVGETLTTTPITVKDSAFAEQKTKLVDVFYSPIGDGNLLGSVHSNTAEITAKISNPSRTGVSIKVNMSADGTHYTEIGWNKTEGYFVDRTHTEDAGINFPQPNYAIRHPSGMGKNNTVLDFYILVDKNNVEVYCDDFTIPFYILTFASPYSDRMKISAESDVTVRELRVNEIASVWRKDDGGSVLYVSETDIELGMGLSSTKDIIATGGDIDWTIVEGSDVIEIEKTSTGATVKARSSGVAVIEVKCGDMTRRISVTVHDGSFNTDLTFNDDGVITGRWFVSQNGLIGRQDGGDGFILAEEEGSDFIYTANFDLGSGAAAAIVFRATEENGRLASYLIANYDNNGRIVKLWSQNGELGNVKVDPADIHNLTITADVKGDNVKISFNGATVINVTLGSNEPKSGRFGLNACATRATFFSTRIVPREYDYESGMLYISVGGSSRVDEVINKTLAHTQVSSAFYFINDGTINLSEDYMSLLPAVGNYEFHISCDKTEIDVVVSVKAIPECIVRSAYVNEGAGASIFVGRRTTEYVKINGTAIASKLYSVENYVLKIDAKALPVGDNVVALSDGTIFTVSVAEAQSELISIQMPPVTLNMIPFIIGMSIVCGIIVLALIAFIVVINLKGKGKIELATPFGDRTAAIRRRNLGLIASACIVGPIALILLVCMLTSPLGFVGFTVAFALTIVFGYAYVAQMFWQGKVYNQSLSAVKAMGTPREIFQSVDRSGNKFKTALNFIGAAFKVLWLCVRILFSSVVALIRSPFLFAGQLHGITYGEFGFSNKAEEPTATA